MSSNPQIADRVAKRTLVSTCAQSLHCSKPRDRKCAVFMAAKCTTAGTTELGRMSIEDVPGYAIDVPLAYLLKPTLSIGMFAYIKPAPTF